MDENSNTPGRNLAEFNYDVWKTFDLGVYTSGQEPVEIIYDGLKTSSGYTMVGIATDPDTGRQRVIQFNPGTCRVRESQEVVLMEMNYYKLLVRAKTEKQGFLGRLYSKVIGDIVKFWDRLKFLCMNENKH